MSLVQQLKDLRDQLARQQGVEPYFVLHLKTIEEIARLRPVTIDALAEIKGLGPKKISQYGEQILSVVSGEPTSAASTPAPEVILTVREYVAQLNTLLAERPARLRGEVVDFKELDFGVVFDFRDTTGEAVIRCFMHSRDYQVMGVILTEGMEVIIGGSPNIYPLKGLLNFRVATVELVGAGKLQQAYLALKWKLAAAGLFDAARKRPLPMFAERIGLVTSERGEAIHDFLANVERVGLKILLRDCRVEGVRAIPELVAAIHQLNRRGDVDVLVVTRGGGSSWEILQPYNNEAVCQTIASSATPVLMGIGHERDVPLAALVADAAVSTPTAAAELISRSWREAKQRGAETKRLVTEAVDAALAEQRNRLEQAGWEIPRRTMECLTAERHQLTVYHERTRTNFTKLQSIFPRLVQRVQAALEHSRQHCEMYRLRLLQEAATTARAMGNALRQATHQLAALSKQIGHSNPLRQLKLGYSLIRKDGKLIKRSGQLRVGDHVELRFAEGGAGSEINKITD